MINNKNYLEMVHQVIDGLDYFIIVYLTAITNEKMSSNDNDVINNFEHTLSRLRKMREEFENLITE